MTTRVSRRLAALEAQQRRPVQVDHVVVYTDGARHEYPSEGAARAAHPELDATNTITIYDERISELSDPTQRN